MDWISLLKEHKSLSSSPLQFGFKKGLSTTQCTHSLLEIIDYYNYNKSYVFVLMLDASKAFDRVRYCKLLKELLKRNIFSCCFQNINIYVHESNIESFSGARTLTSSFKVCNGVKQGGVLSPILFAVYVDSPAW